jgi:hypothetical protein
MRTIRVRFFAYVYFRTYGFIEGSLLAAVEVRVVAATVHMVR